MYVVDYNRTFAIKLVFDSYIERDVYMEYVNNLRRLYLRYESYSFIVPENRIDEILMWFKYFNYEHTLTNSALQKVKEIKDYNSKVETKFYRKIDINYDIFTGTLFEFQKESVKWLLQRNRAYLADDAGLGKTVQLVFVLANLFHFKKIGSSLITVRSGTDYNWLKELTLLTTIFKEQDIELIDNDTKVQPFENFQDKKILIVPNHLVADVFASYKSDYKRGKALSKIRWKPYCNIKQVWNKQSLCLISDEAHEFKNSNAVRTRALLTNKNFFDYRYLLSATPSIDKFEDWWSQTKVLDNSIIPLSENAFKIDIAQSIGNNYSMYSINNYDSNKIYEYKEKFKPYVLKRIKKDISEMKTEQIIKPIYFRMIPLHEDLYREFVQNYLTRLEQEHDRINLKLIMKKFPYLVQVIDNPFLLEEKILDDSFNKKLKKWKFENDPRIQYLDSTLKSYIEEQNEKVIIFDHHPLTLNLLYERYKKYDPIIIHGELKVKDKKKERQVKQDLFNDKNSKYKLFLLSSLIGGAGWNLQYACRRIIFFVLPNYALPTRQALDRVTRITSTMDSIVEILILDHTIDNIRYLRNVKRIEINDSLYNKHLSREEVQRLFLGEI